jgi:predicted ArsR family transcriptional regulator
MHLGKLVDIGLLNAHAQKTGKGGRPGYAYTPSGHAVSLNVPARDFQLLADLLVQSLALMGEGGKAAITQIGRTFGRRLGREAVATSLARASDAQAAGDGQADILRTCAEALERLGVATHVSHRGDGSFSLVLRTCGFREVATAHPEHVCHLCKAMVEGITQTCLEAEPIVTQAASVPRGDKECVYDMDRPTGLEE